LEDWKPEPQERPVKVIFRYRELETAQNFGMSVGEWDLLSKKEKAEMVAFCQIRGEIREYQTPPMKKDKESGN